MCSDRGVVGVDIEREQMVSGDEVEHMAVGCFL